MEVLDCCATARLGVGHTLKLGGDALVSSGIMESLLQFLEWKAVLPMNITVGFIYSGHLFPINGH